MLAQRITLMSITAVVLSCAIAATACVIHLGPDYSDAEPCDAQRSRVQPTAGPAQWVVIDGEYIYGMDEEDVGCYLWEDPRQQENQPDDDAANEQDDDRECEWPEEKSTGGVSGPGAGGFSLSTHFDRDNCRIILSHLEIRGPS